jgi:hypothetical protein
VAYRDDLEAAHARIAALEAENERLRTELEAATKPKPVILKEPPPRARPQPPVEDDETYRVASRIASLQAAMVHTSDAIERAALMRELADLHQHFRKDYEKAAWLRARAAELDPGG